MRYRNDINSSGLMLDYKYLIQTSLDDMLIIMDWTFTQPCCEHSLRLIDKTTINLYFTAIKCFDFAQNINVV